MPPERVPAPVVDIVPLDSGTLDALARGDLAAARLSSGLPLPAVFLAEGWIGTWRRRSAQVRADPASAGWITGAVRESETGQVVGRAGYHGPPDARGMVEVGYATLPGFRRQGYARAALELLLRRAAEEPEVRVVRATIRPDNVASSSLVEPYGFVAVGEQIDPEDGLEIVYELVVADHSPTA